MQRPLDAYRIAVARECEALALRYGLPLPEHLEATLAEAPEEAPLSEAEVRAAADALAVRYDPPALARRLTVGNVVSLALARRAREGRDGG